MSLERKTGGANRLMANVGLSDLCRDCSKKSSVEEREAGRSVRTGVNQARPGNEVRRHLEVPRRLPGWKEGGLGRIERKGGGEERREEGNKGWR